VRFDDGVQLTPIGGDDGAQARSVPSQEVRVNKTSKTAEAELKFKRREDRARDGVKAAEYEAAAVATREKTTRLKALREAKEAADAAAEAAKPAVVKAAKPKKAAKAKKA